MGLYNDRKIKIAQFGENRIHFRNLLDFAIFIHLYTFLNR